MDILWSATLVSCLIFVKVFSSNPTSETFFVFALLFFPFTSKYYLSLDVVILFAMLFHYVNTIYCSVCYDPPPLKKRGHTVLLISVGITLGRSIRRSVDQMVSDHYLEIYLSQILLILGSLGQRSRHNDSFL